MDADTAYTVELTVQGLADLARAVLVDARIDSATVRDTPAGAVLAEILGDLPELHGVPLFRRFLD